MKLENIKTVLILALIVIVLTQTKSCNSEKNKLPEIKGSFEAVKPKHTPITNNNSSITNSQTKSVIQEAFGEDLSKEEINYWKKEYYVVLDEYNSLDSAFAHYNDSLKQVKHRVVIRPKLFSKTWDNDTINATVKGMVFNGEVEKLKLDYTIKSREIPVPKGLFVGGQFGPNKELNQFTYKIDMDYLYKNKIYKTSYQRFQNQDFILIGGSVKLF